MRKLLFILLALAAVANSFAQENNPYLNQKNKGKFYVYAGWNRGFFTKTALHLKGNNYDFTLYKVAAHDRQTPFSFDAYFNPFKWTIPQTNLRVGYFITDKYNISLAIDHMKYVMDQNQTALISGTIANSNTQYDGTYNKDSIVLATDFLKFEHTNGLNYINVEFRRMDCLYSLKKYKIDFNITEGVGLGALVPRTDATLLGNKRNDKFHLAGYGLEALLGVNVTFFKHFFIQSELKGGLIHLPDVRTTEFKSDRASQAFFFLQYNVVVGAVVWFKKFRKETPAMPQ